MLLSGDNNIIEMMVFNDNQDTGLQISRYQTSYTSIDQWPSNNLIKNCTSKNNCDDVSMEKAHELFEPILSKMISLRLESSRLSLLRDTLLPRLMSGEIEIPE